jgi:hypothetical protein
MTCDRPVVFPVPPVASSNKTDHHDITEILLKVTFSTIKQTNKLRQVISTNINFKVTEQTLHKK